MILGLENTHPLANKLLTSIPSFCLLLALSLAHCTARIRTVLYLLFNVFASCD